MTGRVVRLGLTPLKGAHHAPLEAVELDRLGAVGDRVFCLVDTEARRVLRTVQHPALPGVRARWDGSVLDLTLPSGERAVAAPTPSGESVTCDYWGREVELDLRDGPHAALLSGHLGRVESRWRKDPAAQCIAFGEGTACAGHLLVGRQHGRKGDSGARTHVRVLATLTGEHRGNASLYLAGCADEDSQW